MRQYTAGRARPVCYGGWVCVSVCVYRCVSVWHVVYVVIIRQLLNQNINDVI